MKFQRETLFEVIEEVQPLLEKHYDELCVNKAAVKLKPRWDVYAELERIGIFRVFTAREAGKLEGYAAFFVNEALHYADLTVAANDVFYVSEDRRKGLTPARFLRYCEKELAAHGVHKIVYHAKLTNQLAPLLNVLGYGQEEVMCAKLIKEP